MRACCKKQLLSPSRDCRIQLQQINPASILPEEVCTAKGKYSRPNSAVPADCQPPIPGKA